MNGPAALFRKLMAALVILSLAAASMASPFTVSTLGSVDSHSAGAPAPARLKATDMKTSDLIEQREH